MIPDPSPLARPQLTVETVGPFFERDSRQTIRENIADALEQLAAEGEEQIRGASPHFTGAFRAGIKGRVTNLAGKRWKLTAVVSQTHVYPWGARGTRGGPSNAKAEYRGGKLERRVHMFRDASRQLRGLRAVLGADLTKGLS